MAVTTGASPQENSRPLPGRRESGSNTPTSTQIVDQHRLAVNVMQDLAEQVASLAYWSNSASAARWSLTLQFVAEGIDVLGNQMSNIARTVDSKPSSAEEGEATR